MGKLGSTEIILIVLLIFLLSYTLKKHFFVFISVLIGRK